MIPITEVRFDDEAENLVLDVLRSGHVAQGPMVERLEEGFAELAGTRHAVAVSSGTTALVAAVEALELGSGDEVVTSPLTFVATVNAILEAGATVRFADVSLADALLDVEALGAAVGERTRAVMPVHLYGQPVDMEAVAALAAERGVAVIEDAAQAHGARVGERPVGSYGVGCFSLYATKNLTTGEGGVLTTDDDSHADRLRLLRNQGMRTRYEYEMAGHNYRLTDLQAALGVAQLPHLRATTERRQANAAFLSEVVDGLPGIEALVEHAGRTHVHHQFTVRVTGDARASRDDAVSRLSAAGVGSAVYYPRAVYDYDCYRDHPRVVIGESPRAEQLAREVLSVPVHHHLGEQDLEQIAAALQEVFGG